MTYSLYYNQLQMKIKWKKSRGKKMRMMKLNAFSLSISTHISHVPRKAYIVTMTLLR